MCSETNVTTLKLKKKKNTHALHATMISIKVWEGTILIAEVKSSFISSQGSFIRQLKVTAPVTDLLHTVAANAAAAAC